MKKLKYVFAIVLATVLMTGCSSSASEDFEEINGATKKKRIKGIVAKENQNPLEELSVDFTYNSENKLSKITTKFDSTVSIVSYNNTNGVINVTEQQFTESFNTESLFNSPYNAYETGEVLEYDSNKNPSKILFRYKTYDYLNNMYVIENYTVEMFYDTKPNLYFGTLEAAGLIDVLDGVKLDFGISPQAAEIVKARTLFPVNNLVKAVYKNADEQTVGTLEVNYTYDNDGYPIKAVSQANNDKEAIAMEVIYSYN